MPQERQSTVSSELGSRKAFSAERFIRSSRLSVNFEGIG